MNYPVWQLDFAGGGLLIAVIAVVHVYISHFAVGGGLFLIFAERKGLREKSPDIIEYTRKHTKFFLLLTLVLGNLTGVGIWFTISLLNPAATSKLIHLFVFAWAIEWLFFTIEIAFLLAYYYTFGRIDEKKHLIIGWIYFLTAWGSLFIINGIIDFMLTPGDWPATGNFWSAFFNPTFWPALFFRSFLALIIAGLFGLLTSTFLQEKELRHKMVRYCAGWLIIPFILLIASAFWYQAALPAHLKQAIFRDMPELTPYISIFAWISPLIILTAITMAFRIPQSLRKGAAFALLLMGLAYIGSFEFIREGGRRPYIIYNYMYSNGLLKNDSEEIKKKGFLNQAKWANHKEITSENKLEAGAELFANLCLPCHSIGGPLNDIKSLTADYSLTRMESLLNGMGKINTYMPPFAGNEEERKALAAYIIEGLHDINEGEKAVRITKQKDIIPTFHSKEDKYILLAWNKTGMHSITDSSSYWLITPPGNTLYAQLIKRGPVPEVISKEITVSYKVEEGFANPSRHIDFWNNSEEFFQDSLKPDAGLTGNTLSGLMKMKGPGIFAAEEIPVVPFPDSGGYQPYPSFEITARSEVSGEVLAETRVVAPVTNEIGCSRCHGNPESMANRPGISKNSAGEVLAVHDRISHTSLLNKAKEGKPVLCRSCHSASNSQKDEAAPLNLSAAIHGFHANYLEGYGDQACNFCHGGFGPREFYRGIHETLMLGCTECHGSMAENALSLLRAEKEKGKKQALKLMENLSSEDGGSEKIKPRIPWINQPDCLNCHVDFQPPRYFSTFNEWTAGEDELYRNRLDNSGSLRCAACHGSPHALYPARNLYSPDRDVIQPLQYQNSRLPIGSDKNCQICHTVEMDLEMHHPNSLRMFRNK